MVFGRRGDDYDDEEEEIELVAFQGALDGSQPDLKSNARLVRAGLDPAKEAVTDALSRRAEMLRIDPKGKVAVMRFYIDGIAYPGGRMPRQEAHAITQMLKLLAGLDIQERSKPQAGGLKAEYEETPYELQIKSEPTEQGVERLIVRLENVKTRVYRPEDLGFTDEMREKIRELSSDKHGMLLACGAPGTGVSTALYGMLRSIDAYLYQIYSICKYMEQDVANVSKFEVLPEDDLERTLMRVVRVDADVVLVDPLKDVETVRTLMEMQKQLCIVSEFTARDVVHGLHQLIKWAGDPQTAVDSVSLLISPRLIRKLCPRCRQAFRPNPKLLAKIGLPPKTKVLYRAYVETDEDLEDPEYDQCKTCGGTGFLGRIAMLEMLWLTDAMKQIVLAGAEPAKVRAQMREDGMPTLQQSGLRLVGEGVTALEELQRVFRKS